MKKLTAIYKSSKRAEMYLYVDVKEELSRVPEALMKQFGEATLVTKLVLTPEKKLARADVAKVLEQIEAQGFYLQMPPQPEDYLQELKKQ